MHQNKQKCDANLVAMCILKRENGRVGEPKCENDVRSGRVFAKAQNR